MEIKIRLNDHKYRYDVYQMFNIYFALDELKFVDDGEYIINIEEPIYPSENLTEKGNTNVMRDKNFEVWKNIYEKFYKIPLEYLTTTENEKEEDAL